MLMHDMLIHNLFMLLTFTLQTKILGMDFRVSYGIGFKGRRRGDGFSHNGSFRGGNEELQSWRSRWSRQRPRGKGRRRIGPYRRGRFHLILVLVDACIIGRGSVIIHSRHLLRHSLNALTRVEDVLARIVLERGIERKSKIKGPNTYSSSVKIQVVICRPFCRRSMRLKEGENLMFTVFLCWVHIRPPRNITVFTFYHIVPGNLIEL